MADDETPEEIADPVRVIQDQLSDLDPESLCIGFVTVAEFLEPDGSHSLAVLHTDMAPWHLHGLMAYGQQHNCLAESYAYLEDEDEE